MRGPIGQIGWRSSASDENLFVASGLSVDRQSSRQLESVGGSGGGLVRAPMGEFFRVPAAPRVAQLPTPTAATRRVARGCKWSSRIGPCGDFRLMLILEILDPKILESRRSTAWNSGIFGRKQPPRASCRLSCPASETTIHLLGLSLPAEKSQAERQPVGLNRRAQPESLENKKIPPRALPLSPYHVLSSPIRHPSSSEETDARGGCRGATITNLAWPT